jgi:hypothetical protein
MTYGEELDLSGPLSAMYKAVLAGVEIESAVWGVFREAMAADPKQTTTAVAFALGHTLGRLDGQQRLDAQPPAYQRVFATAKDDDERKLLAISHTLWGATGGDVPMMLVLLGQLAAVLAAPFGPKAAETFVAAFREAVPLARKSQGAAVTDEPAGAA